MANLTAAEAAKLREEARGTKSLEQLRKHVDEQVAVYSKIGAGQFDLLHTPAYVEADYVQLIEDLKKDGYGVAMLLPGISRITW